jgi:diguanylate cyclase (GGDEF)-like protein
MAPGEHGASCGHEHSRISLISVEWSSTINHDISLDHQTSSLWMEQIYSQFSSTQSILRLCTAWIFELGIASDMPFFQQISLALINRAAFISLLLALPGTFLLILMDFGHPFSLLVSGVLLACLTLGLNGIKRVAWSMMIFALSPAVIILTYSLLELSSRGLTQPLNYLLARQGLCFALLLPIILFGFADRQKVVGLLGGCVLIFLVFDVGIPQLGIFQQEIIMGLSQGLFSLLSLLQYVSLAGCVLYLQSQIIKHEYQVQRRQEKLQKLAIRDGLTGLFNHKFMEQLVGDAINRSKRSHIPLALLMIDIDYFKQVNDTFGHNKGDDVLLRVTRLLYSHKRSTDYLGRWGGDELMVLLTDTDLSGAANLAEKLRLLVKNHFFPHCKQITISLGASEYQHGDNPTSFIARADAALYQAKHLGRNRVSIQA